MYEYIFSKNQGIEGAQIRLFYKFSPETNLTTCQPWGKHSALTLTRKFLIKGQVGSENMRELHPAEKFFSKTPISAGAFLNLK